MRNLDANQQRIRNLHSIKMQRGYDRLTWVPSIFLSTVTIFLTLVSPWKYFENIKEIMIPINQFGYNVSKVFLSARPLQKFY